MSLIRFTLLHFLQFIICGVIGVYLRFSRIDHSIDYLGVLSYGISEDSICNIEHILAGIGLPAVLILLMMGVYVSILNLVEQVRKGNAMPLLAVLACTLYFISAYEWEIQVVPHSNIGNQLFYDVLGLAIYALIWTPFYGKNGGAITQKLKSL